MTLTNTEAVTDLSILEALDFQASEPCEIAHRHGRAEYLVEQIPGVCPDAKQVQAAICRSCWDSAGERGVMCPRCLAHLPRDESWRLLGRL